MIPTNFSAYFVERGSTGQVQGAIQSLEMTRLVGEVLIKVEWTSLNYKDALAATGHPGVARRLPHVPGVDAAGIVAEVPDGSGLRVGDEVVVTGFELGAGHWGGWSEYVRVPVAWIVKRPPSLSLRDTMVLGTAGFTAAQCVDSLLHHGIGPGAGDIVVTGATGGVGCIAVMLLAKLGYRVTAITGKPTHESQLRQWGAAHVLGRDAVLDKSGKPLLAGKWLGAVDTVGGETLGTILRQTKDQGCVTACGLVGGTDLPTSVYPFILRGVTLAGITSAGCPSGKRQEIWEKLSGAWRLDQLDSITTEIPLAKAGEFVPRILAGEIVGRTVIRI